MKDEFEFKLDGIMMLLLSIPVVIFFGLFLYSMVLAAEDSNARNEACNKIDMEYYTAQDSTFCVDNEGKAHYVKIDCKKISWIKFDCIPRIISIGDIRTIGG